MLTVALKEFRVVSPKAVPQQVARFVRRVIVAGQLHPQTKLPPTAELARQWKVRVASVHAALDSLVKEGLLVRQPGKGTFVCRPEERLTRVGIYHSNDVFAPSGSEFGRSVHTQLKLLLNRDGIQTDVWIDPRSEEEQARPWEALLSAVQNRRIQGLISMPGGWPRLRWQNKLPLPTAFLCSANLPNAVSSDLRQLAELSLRRLAEQGCRSIGLITALWPGASDPSGLPHDHLGFFERFTDAASDLKLAVRTKWMRVAKHEDEMRGKSQETWGYREFKNLWKQPQHPDGLMVFPDTAARGVVMGLLEARVCVPDELKLALHKNEGVELLCPLPASFVVSSEREFAQALIEQVQQQFRGESCERKVVGFREFSNAECRMPNERQGSEVSDQ